MTKVIGPQLLLLTVGLRNLELSGHSRILTAAFAHISR